MAGGAAAVRGGGGRAAAAGGATRGTRGSRGAAAAPSGGGRPAARSQTPGIIEQPVHWAVDGPRASGGATCRKCQNKIAHDEPRLRMYQRLGYGNGSGYAQQFWHVDCPDGRVMGQVHGYSVAVHQQVVAAQGQVAARRQQERAREEAQRARAQPSVRAFFGPPPAGE